MLGSAMGSPLLTQFNSPKSLLARHCLNLGPLYRDVLISGSGVCPRCGREIAVDQWLPGDALPAGELLYGMYLHCPRCDLLDGDLATTARADSAPAVDGRRNGRVPVTTPDVDQIAVQEEVSFSPEDAERIHTALDRLEPQQARCLCCGFWKS